VLKPTIVGPHIGGHGPAFRRQKIGELDFFVTQPEAYDATARAEHSGQQFIRPAGYFDVVDPLEGQNLGVERQCSIHIGHRQPNRRDGCDRERRVLRAAGGR
jgi:hypothetical protein